MPNPVASAAAITFLFVDAKLKETYRTTVVTDGTRDPRPLTNGEYVDLTDDNGKHVGIITMVTHSITNGSGWLSIQTEYQVQTG